MWFPRITDKSSGALHLGSVLTALAIFLGFMVAGGLTAYFGKMAGWPSMLNLGVKLLVIGVFSFVVILSVCVWWHLSPNTQQALYLGVKIVCYTVLVVMAIALVACILGCFYLVVTGLFGLDPI